MNGIIVDGKVYKLSISTDLKVCERCAFGWSNGCDAPHWLNCNNIALRFSPELTDKLNK